MQAVDKVTYSNDWITILYIILFIAIVILKLIDTNKVKESFLSFLSFSLIKDDSIERKKKFDTFQIVVFLFSVTVLSLVLYKFKLLKISQSEIGLTSFLPIFIGLLFYLFLKRILEYFLVLLFMIKKRLQFFLFFKNNFLSSVCFLLFISLVLSEYTNLNTKYVLFFAIFLFILRFIFLVLRNKKLVFNKLFYFILYLCALEIAPLFVLFKLMF